ncbi:MAG: acylneuraminate cytidylyltransferase family protein [Gemmobacter sp.]|nr:acylneuraminate cytidylyltransferase family protein [Gemmobacter sp.]
MTERLIALVPLRAGSKGLPGKNVRLLAGKPLFRHAVDQGLAAGAEVWISTDIPELAAMDHGAGVQVMARPADLAADSTPMDPVIAHALGVIGGAGRVVLLQATSPLRTAADILDGVAVHKTGAHDLVMSVCAADRGVLKWGTIADGTFHPLRRPEYCFMNRQALPAVHRPNGAVYVFDADWFRTRGSLATDRIGAFEMPLDRSLDIDGADDFSRAEDWIARNM